LEVLSNAFSVHNNEELTLYIQQKTVDLIFCVTRKINQVTLGNGSQQDLQ